MSFDIGVSFALLVGAALLMMRFGCAARMGHAHGSRASPAGHADGAGSGGSDSFGHVSVSGVKSGPPATGQSPARAGRHGCC